MEKIDQLENWKSSDLFTEVERITLAVLAARLKQQTDRPVSQFKQLIRLVQPETVFRWHRDLVRRKWTQESQGKRGRPRIDGQKEYSDLDHIEVVKT